MSDLCHVCGPEKHEAPTVICAPCSLNYSAGGASAGMESSAPDGPRKEDSAPSAGGFNPRSYDPRACPRCGSLMLTTSAGERCVELCA